MKKKKSKQRCNSSLKEKRKSAEAALTNLIKTDLKRKRLLQKFYLLFIHVPTNEKWQDTSDISFEAENASVVFMKPAATQLTRPPSSGGPSDSVLDLAFYTDLIVRSVAAFK